MCVITDVRRFAVGRGGGRVAQPRELALDLRDRDVVARPAVFDQ